MIILDTNVVSEVMRPAPSAIVGRWFSHQNRAELYTTAVAEAELLLGLELMPKGKRRLDMERIVTRLFAQVLIDRVLPFDRNAAREFALIVSDRRRRGHSGSTADAQIAAIARSRGAILATRNVRDFEHCGIEVVDPWAE